MKKTIIILLFLYSIPFVISAQQLQKSDSNDRKFNGFLSMLTDVTVNEKIHFSSSGIGGALLINNSFFIGGYGMGIASSLHRSDLISDNNLKDYHVNFAHGGLWLGYKNEAKKLIHVNYSLKLGWGALFFEDVNSTINYNQNRIQFFVATPCFDFEIAAYRWINFNIGIGVRFISNFTSTYTDANKIQRKLFSSNDFEGFILNFAINFGDSNPIKSKSYDVR